MNKIPYWAAALTALLAWSAINFLVSPETFGEIYDQKLQLACFTGFLTVGSFLLAMKAFILVRLREDVYGHAAYKRRYLGQNNNKYAGDYYRGLVELGNLLAVSVIVAFSASVAQVTIGFSSAHGVKAIALALCAGGLALVLIDWLFVYLNLKDWFEFIEEDARQDMAAP